MNINQAIKTLQGIADDEESTWTLAGENALKLGIEALKREVIWRQNDPGGSIHPLPGETEE